MSRRELLTATIYCLLECQAWKEPEKFNSRNLVHEIGQKTSPVESHFIFLQSGHSKSFVGKTGKKWREEENTYWGRGRVLYLDSYCHLTFTPPYQLDIIPILQIRKPRPSVKAISPKTKPY